MAFKALEEIKGLSPVNLIKYFELGYFFLAFLFIYSYILSDGFSGPKNNSQLCFDAINFIMFFPGDVSSNNMIQGFDMIFDLIIICSIIDIFSLNGKNNLKGNLFELERATIKVKH